MSSGSLTSGSSFGRYRVRQLLVADLTGETYDVSLVDERASEERFVLRVGRVGREGDDDLARAIAGEIAVARQLHHRNIVASVDHGELDGRPYLVLEHVDGTNWEEVLAAQRGQTTRVPVAASVWIAHEVLQGLAYVHGLRDERGAPLGLVHCTLSPAKVLLSRRGEVKVGGFGGARGAGLADRTRAGMVHGGMGYLAPEQVRGAAVDHRADIFNVGLLLYEALTGQPAFDRGTKQKLVDRLLEGGLESPARRREGVSAALDGAVMRALAVNPADRFQRCEELATLLAAHLDASRAREAAVSQVQRLVGGTAAAAKPQAVTCGPAPTPTPAPSVAARAPSRAVASSAPARPSTPTPSVAARAPSRPVASSAARASTPSVASRPASRPVASATPMPTPAPAPRPVRALAVEPRRTLAMPMLASTVKRPAPAAVEVIAKQREVGVGLQPVETVEATSVAAVEAIGERPASTDPHLVKTIEVRAAGAAKPLRGGLRADELRAVETLELATAPTAAAQRAADVAMQGLRPADTSEVTSVAAVAPAERTDARREVTRAAPVEELGEHQVSHTAATALLARGQPAPPDAPAPASVSVPTATADASASLVLPRRRARVGLVLLLCGVLGALTGLTARLVARRFAEDQVVARAGPGDTVRHGTWSVRVEAMERPASKAHAVLRVAVHAGGPGREISPSRLLQVTEGRQMIAPHLVSWADDRRDVYRFLFHVSREGPPLELRFAPPGERALLVSLAR